MDKAVFWLTLGKNACLLGAKVVNFFHSLPTVRPMLTSLSTSSRPAAHGIILAFFKDATPAKHEWFSALPAGIRQTILAFSKAKEFSGKSGEVHVIPFGSPMRRVVL